MKAWALVTLVLLSGCGGGSRGGFNQSGASTSLECAPFARQLSGIQLYGEAYTWWDQAGGRYGRGSEPVEGGVLVFRQSSRLPYGHVSVVAHQVSDREIRVTQSNWVHRKITRNEPVVDVSPGNDWSQVRVWWDPSNAIGTTTYQTYGFIAPDRSRSRSDILAGVVTP